MYQPISYLKDLKECFQQLKQEFNATKDPNPTDDLLEKVLKMLKFAEEDIKQNVYSDFETKKFFFEEFIYGLTKRLIMVKGEANQKNYALIEEIGMSMTSLFVNEMENDNSDMADAMRYLFDYKCELHQSTITEKADYEQQFEEQHIASRLDEEEKKWRDELGQGSKLDAVKIESDYSVKSWSKAVVLQVLQQGSVLEVDFENETTRLVREIHRYSAELAQYNTKTQGDEWKEELNIGDLVDACDLTKAWYSSTIVDKEVRTYGDKDVLFLKVGFRKYDERGTKTDLYSKKFFGWSESFDEWLPAYSPRIQMFQSLPNVWEQQIQLIKADDFGEDQMDAFLYSRRENEEPIFAVYRKKCHSQLLVNMLNLFGNKGGFELMLKKIGDNKTGLEMVFYYLECLANSYIMYSRPFYAKFVEELTEVVTSKLLTSSEQLIRNIKKERIDGMLHNLLAIKIGSVFLDQNLLEKRIDGVKYIQDVCKSVNISTYQTGKETLMNNTMKQHLNNFIREIVTLINDKNILYQIFSRERSHAQLVLRSEEILKLLLSEDVLTTDELSLIWSCTKIDEEIQLELYKLFNEISHRFRPQDLAFIIEKLSKKSNANKEEIELIHELAKRSKSADYQYSKLAAEYMWNIAMENDQKIDKSLVNQAALSFSDIIKYWPIEQKVTYTDRLISNLNQNKEGFLTIKMLTRMFKDFIGTYQTKVDPEIAVEKVDDKAETVEKSNDKDVDGQEITQEEQKKIEEENGPENSSPQSFESKSHFLNYIAEKYDLFEVLQKNFESYMQKVKQIVLQKIEEKADFETSGLGDKCICDRFIHSDQITERLEFLNYCAQNAKNLQISVRFLESLWDQLVKGSMIQSDSELFFRWMREVCEQCSQGFFLVDIQTLLQFYRERIANSVALKFLTLEGFNCIQTFFVLINESQRKLLKLNQQSFQPQQIEYENTRKSNFTSFSSTSGGTVQNFSFNQQPKHQQSMIGPTPPPLLNLQNNNHNTYQTYQNVDPEDLEVQTLVYPDQLEGINGLWVIALETSDNKVHERANQFLIKLYTTVSYKFEDQLPQFEDSFIKRCMDTINEQITIISTRQQPPKEEYAKVENKHLLQFTNLGNSMLQKLLPPEERKIAKCITLLKDIIKNSEKEGTNGIRPHSALIRGEYLDSISISNSLRNGTKFSTKIEIGCYSNLTLWEFKKLVAQRIALTKNQDGSLTQEQPTHPSLVRLYRYSQQNEFTDIENGRSLSDLKFKKNENLTAFKKSIYTSNKIPLLDESGTQLCEKALKIFKSWFQIYSEEDPDHPGTRVMTPKTCVEFTRSCTEDPCDENDQRVVGLFALYDHDHDNKIQEEEFIQFFVNSSREKEDIVRQNLMMHQIKNDLSKVVKDSDPEDILQPRKTVFDMPRYKLANNPDHYETMFKLLESENELSSYAWAFIKQIATNPNLYWKILYLDKRDDFQWEQVFDSSNIYKMLYSLQIIESLLEENPNFIGNYTIEDSLKKDWTKRFLQSNGFQQILTLFHKALNMLSAKQADQLVKFEKYFLEYMLKLIKIFMMSAFKASSNLQNAFEDLSLIKQGSSYKEEANKKNEMKEEKTNEQEFTTPAKQVKGKFVNTGKVHPAQGFEIVPEQMTEEYLFDEPTDKQDNQAQEEQTKVDQQIQQEDTDDMFRFSELTNIMQQSGLGEEILEKINFEELQGQILELICMILAKKEFVLDDINIIEKAMSLWVASLIRNENLINQFYLFKRSEEKAGKYGVKNCDDFILQGLYTYKSQKVREEFSNSLIFISQKIRKNQGKIPLIYIMSLLKNNFPKEDNYYATRECKQYFDLMVKLIDEYFQFVSTPGGAIYLDLPRIQSNFSFLLMSLIEYAGETLDVFDLLKESIEKLKKYEGKEKKTSYFEDKNLLGYFNLITQLIQALANIDKKHLNEVLEQNDFLNELFYQSLFFDQQYSLQENKCKTKESRAQALLTLSAYIQILEPKELADFLQFYVWPLLEKSRKPKKWCYTPSENQRTFQYVGIVNLGCICYMNSMLQHFFMIPAFRYQLMKANDETPSNIVEYKGLQIEDNMLKQLQKLFGHLELSDRQAYDPTEFCYAFKDFDGNPTNTALQQDAQEFLNIFFDRLENLLKPTSQRHLLQSIFEGKLCSQLICPNCGIIRNILESFYNLSLVVKDRKGIEDSLEKMIEGGVINDYKCDKCDQKVDVVKRSLIAETPNVLFIHLQRIVFNFDTFQNDKINSRFEFPNILKLKNFSVKEVMTGEKQQDQIESQEDLKHLMGITDEEYTYRLVGVTIHIGTAEQGHYFSLINCKRGNEEPDEQKPEWMTPEKDVWKVFEDEKVKFYSFNDLKVDSFGGNSQASMNDNDINAYLTSNGGSFGKNAYMLVYERQKKLPLIEFSEEVSLDCADTAVSRENPVKEEVSQQVDFKKVDPFVPDWIKSIVLSDNQHFTIDKQLFNDSFFNLMKSIYKYISDKILLSQHRYQLDYLPHFQRLKKKSLQISKKLMFELLAYFFHNTSMSDINSHFGSIIMFCDSSYHLDKGDPSLICEFIEDTYLQDNCLEFFNIMFNCTDKTSRFYIGRMTSTVINKAFSLCSEAKNKDSPIVQELKAAAEKFLLININILSTSDCQKNWSRLENFLKMINEIGLGGDMQIHFLLTQFDIVTFMVDFMLGNQSPLANQNQKRPNMGAGMNNPPFEPLIQMLCHLIRYSLTTTMKDEEPLWTTIDNPPPSTLLGYKIEQDQGNPEKYPLTSSGELMFFSQTFIDKIFKDGYECEEFGKALAHFCYKNEKISKKVAKTLLKGISKNDFERIKNYLDVVTQVVFLKDNLQRVRLEWIFGYGSLNSSSNYQSISETEQSNETKVGIQLLSNIVDEPYQFKSALLLDSQDDALLHMLWRYKGRTDQYTVNCLQQLVQIISADRDISNYFSTLPGPTYCYARYTDWIRSYLNDQLLDARKGYSGSYSQGKEEQIIKTLSQYEIYEKYLKEKDGQILEEGELNQQENVSSEGISETQEKKGDVSDEQEEEENVKNLIQKEEGLKPKIIHIENSDSYNPTKIIQCQPQPYIIIECLNTQFLSQEKEVDNNDVSLIISQLQCSYTMSIPTGYGNLSIPENLLRRGYNYQKRAQQSVSGQGKGNREQEMQTFSINSHFESKNLNKQVSEDQEADDKKEKKVKFNEFKEDKDEEIAAMQVSDLDESNDENQEGWFEADTSNQAYQIKVVETGGQVQNVVEEGQKIDMPDQNMEQQKSQVVEDETQATWQSVSICNDLIYKFHVVNDGDDIIKYNLSFSVKNENEEINLAWPRSCVKGKLFAHQSRTAILLPKIIPLERNENEKTEVEKLTVTFKTKKLAQDQKQRSYPGVKQRRNGFNDLVDQSKVPRLDLGKEGMHTTSVAVGDEDNAIYSADGEVVQLPIEKKNDTNDNYNYQEGFEGETGVGVKQCPQCTLNNPSNYVMCEVCEYVF